MRNTEKQDRSDNIQRRIAAHAATDRARALAHAIRDTMEDTETIPEIPPCTSENPDYPGLTCHFIACHAGDHYALGYRWPQS